MSTRTELCFPDATIDAITRRDTNITLTLSEFHIYISLAGSAEQTKWRQAGELIIENAALQGEAPACPCVVSSGDLHDNMYTYRDMIPLPLDSRGEVGCTLTLEGIDSKLVIMGDRIRLDPVGERKYIGHVRPD